MAHHGHFGRREPTVAQPAADLFVLTAFFTAEADFRVFFPSYRTS
jgi:hypothetical protein